MSKLQEEIQQEADGITAETRVCGITQQRIGGLFTKIGTELAALDAAKETPKGAQDKASKAQRDAERYADTKVANLVDSSPEVLNTLNELAAALGNDANFATTITNALSLKANTTEVALKADKDKTFTLMPRVGANIPVPYYRQPSMWYSSTGDSDIRGWYLNLGDAEKDVQLRFLSDGSKGLEIHCRAGIKNGSVGTVEVLHTGNTMQVVKAGKVSEDVYESYMGTPCSVSWTGSTCTLSHFIDWGTYMVNITPWGSAKSFSIIAKNINSCDIQFSAVTPFEVQIAKY